jgi:non-ribosomal peptide synthetase component F
MSGREIKSEVIRLVNTVDADRMEDLLSTIRVFTDQQNIETDIDHNSPELLKKLNQSLHQAESGQLISNEDVLKEVKRVLRAKVDSSGKG